MRKLPRPSPESRVASPALYTHCLFCHADLGRNEVIESFPIGRRLAFDDAKGRLWVVCRRCAGWNLTPVEQRWEAIEACERAFRDTRTRVSTDNIGLARLPAGLELVRVGPALRPEFAAWRYGERFGRRRRAFAATGALTALGMGAAWVAGLGVLVPAVAPGIAIVVGAGLFTRESREAQRFVKRVLARGTVGERLGLSDPGKNAEVRLRPAAGEHGWALRVESQLGHHVDFEGPDALRTAAVLLPAANCGGGGRRTIQSAVGQLESVGHPERYFRRALDEARTRGLAYSSVGSYPREIRLALEMAAHEEAERRAMEGELALLEDAWRDAEEIAAIADDLLLPAGTPDQLGRLRRRAARRGSASA